MPHDHPLLVGFFRALEDAGGDQVAEHAACTELVASVADALLRQLGQDPPPGTVAERVVLAIQLEPVRRDRLYAGGIPISAAAMLPELLTAVRVLDSCVPDGRGVVLPDISPFASWHHLCTSTHSVATELLGSVTPVTPPVRPLDVDAEDGHQLVVDVLALGLPVADSVAAVYGALHERAPSNRWAALARLPYEEEIVSRRGFVEELVGRCPPDGVLRALWFGVTRLRRRGELTFDVLVMGAIGPIDDGLEWLEVVDWRPPAPQLRSEVAHRIHEIAHPALGRGAELAVLLHACLLARSLTEHRAIGTGRRMQAAASFVGGTEIGLGWFGCDVAPLPVRRPRFGAPAGR